MNFKLIGILIYYIVYLYEAILIFIENRSSKNPMPDNVKDLYDQVEFEKWQKYNSEKCLNSFFSKTIVFITELLLFAFNFYPMVCRGKGIYAAAMIVILCSLAVELIVSLPLSWRNTMVIEQKYGFNKTSPKTFFLDTIKETLISAILVVGLCLLFALLYIKMGVWLLVLFTAIAMVILLAVIFLYPILTKIFNKFTPLEDGDLKTKLTTLLEKHGYTVRGIFVMDASRRTTKSNAYFSGYGKMKTIVLYDNLVNSMTSDEICAVFAHELGHGLHHDTLKNTIFSFVNIVIMVLAAWFTVRTPEIFTSFGFEDINYGFAFLVLTTMEIALIEPLMGLAINAHSRKAEYRADAQAVSEGYGADLCSGLKKLSKENFSNLAPSRTIVALKYSHPTLSQRLAAIETLMNK